MLIAYQIDNVFMLLGVEEGTRVKDVVHEEVEGSSTYHNGKKAIGDTVLQMTDFVHTQTPTYNKDEPVCYVKYYGRPV